MSRSVTQNESPQGVLRLFLHHPVRVYSIKYIIPYFWILIGPNGLLCFIHIILYFIISELCSCTSFLYYQLIHRLIIPGYKYVVIQQWKMFLAVPQGTISFQEKPKASLHEEQFYWDYIKVQLEDQQAKTGQRYKLVKSRAKVQTVST